LIKDYFEKFSAFLVPHGLYKMFSSRKEKLETAKFNKFMEKQKKRPIKRFGIATAEGEECVILGNGPSLKNSLSGETLEFIRNKKKFCVNESILSEEFLTLKPDYVVLMDPYYWSKNTGEPYKTYYLKDNEVLSKVDWKIKVFLPKPASEWNFFIDIPEKNKNVEIVYINTQLSQQPSEELKFIEYRQNLSMPRVQNVLVACLYLAINAGFKTSYIFGADHSWCNTLHVTEDNKLCYINSHFYDKEEVTTHQPLYRNPECTETWTIGDFFEALSYKFKTYDELEKYSKYMGSKIVNASEVSYIDAFERLAKKPAEVAGGLHE